MKRPTELDLKMDRMAKSKKETIIPKGLKVDFSDVKKVIEEMTEEIQEERNRKHKKGLCFRCEHRARYLEEGSSPRYQCGDVSVNSSGCYMYQPVRPVVLKRNTGDKRPQFASYVLSARSQFVRVDETAKLKLKEHKDGNELYWVPAEKSIVTLVQNTNFKIGQKVKTTKGCRMQGNNWTAVVVGYAKGIQSVKVKKDNGVVVCCNPDNLVKIK